MSTAVLIRRPTAAADLATAEGSHWTHRSACRTAEADRDFYGTSAAAQARARATCLSCPVRLECLTERSAVDVEENWWGMVGGLDAEQRRVLEVAELIGERPDLKRAQELLTPRWRYRLYNLRAAGHAPQRIADILTAEGIAVDAITVRVAVWWTGGPGRAISRRASRDRRPLWQRLRDDYADVICLLRARGARHVDVAAYLGVRVTTLTRATQELEAAA
ncbi:WhiB family transcriptional regulator [Streptomyces sp. NPDC014986]|uniref:WhiB family transcriptional regulator n=1 Tax=Streptomyces sp. NPDC014986 TaxID=3364934 RepID=UPI0036F54078